MIGTVKIVHENQVGRIFCISSQAVRSNIVQPQN